MFTANYGQKSPILQRGRFAVILEEPQTQTPGTPPPERLDDAETRRSPSPEWDFDDEVSFFSSEVQMENSWFYLNYNSKFTFWLW